MTEIEKRWVYLASPSDLIRLASLDGVHLSWPPPGVTIHYAGVSGQGPPFTSESDRTLFYGSGSPTAGGPDDWWVTTLGDLIADVWVVDPGLLADWLRILEAGGHAVAQGVLAYPVIYKANRGAFMRWTSCTLRGELGGGVEQFQHKFDFGLPGADPDIDEERGLTLATAWAGFWANKWTTLGISTYFSPDVQYTEVGVVQKTQTDGTDSQGEGGNLEESFATQWFMYPTASRPGGSGGTTLPYEVATALTLQTDHRGASGRGRSYLPPFAVGAMDPGGTFKAAFVHDTAAMVGAFFEAVMGDSEFVPVVVSRRRIILNTITTIEVGKVPDSQRRRRRSQDEAYNLAWTNPVS